MSKVALIGGTVGVGGRSLALATVLMCGSLFGVTVEWTPGATSLADGAVTITVGSETHTFEKGTVASVHLRIV